MEDAHLWWTVMDTSHKWSEDEKFTNHRTKSNPALAVFQGKLYCVHRGDADGKLWWTMYDPGSEGGWTEDKPFPNHYSKEGPALAVFNNHLYCVHRGGSDASLWWTRFNGNSWTTDTRLADHFSGAGPAIVSYRSPNGTEDQLFCVHRGN
ncbi:hypothetical protein [Streptomyces sp. NPDC090445]|uniref:hypothetical protein n=1 Tax=Streptomyces sp. NPDC090445 TaxID=3365963 RepID=UPI0037FC33ED